MEPANSNPGEWIFERNYGRRAFSLERTSVPRSQYWLNRTQRPGLSSRFEIIHLPLGLPDLHSLGNACRFFILNQLLSADETHPNSRKFSFDSPGPCLIERHSGNRSQEINAVGGHTELDHLIGPDKICRLQTERA